MRASLLPLLRCPRCRTERGLDLEARASDPHEVREGEVACAACGGRFGVAAGIVDLLPDPPPFVAREAAGLERFAEVMRADGWDRDRILRLPDVDIGYWRAQRRAMQEVLATVAFAPGQRLLDVGSNTCWASHLFARRGLEVVALDITTTELQGLRTADYFLASGEVHFERLVSVMFDPALASDAFDFVFCSEVLHHNDRAHLRRTLRELFRVLRPGGRLIVANEPMRFLLRPKLDHGGEVAGFEGNEHVYFLHEYVLAARAAGFRVIAPWLRGVPPAGAPVPPTPPGAGPRTVLRDRLRRSSTGRALLAGNRVARYAWRHAIAGDAALMLECVKPPGPRAAQRAPGELRADQPGKPEHDQRAEGQR